jgi:hypothetical protein
MHESPCPNLCHCRFKGYELDEYRYGTPSVIINNTYSLKNIPVHVRITNINKISNKVFNIYFKGFKFTPKTGRTKIWKKFQKRVQVLKQGNKETNFLHWYIKYNCTERNNNRKDRQIKRFLTSSHFAKNNKLIIHSLKKQMIFWLSLSLLTVEKNN